MTGSKVFVDPQNNVTMEFADYTGHNTYVSFDNASAQEFSANELDYNIVDIA